MLKRLDRDILAAWVVASDIHATAAMKQTEIDAGRDAVLLTLVGGTLNAEGTRVGGQLQQSPYLPIINRQALIMARLASELGFSPVSRSRVDVGKAPDEGHGNAFANF
jgi:phage terminase small subunit